MREHLSAETEFAAFALRARETPGLFIFLEGDDDLLLIEDHVSDPVFVDTLPGGKPTAIEFAKLIDAAGARRARVVIDRDYDSVEKVSSYPECIVTTQTHDFFMDILLVAPAVLSRVINTATDKLRRIGSGSTRSRERPSADEIISKSLDAAAKVAALRAVAEYHNLSLKFKATNFDELVSGNLGISDIISSIPGWGDLDLRMQNVLILESKALFEGEETPSPWFYVGDHDFFKALAAQLKLEGAPESAKGLQQGVIRAATCKSIRSSSWHQRLFLWCQSFGYGDRICGPVELCEI